MDDCSHPQLSQDALAQLFAQNMHLAQSQGLQSGQPREPSTIQAVHPTTEKNHAATQHIHYASSHYTATAHIRPQTTSEFSGSPPPSYNEAQATDLVAATLREHSIDPSALLPAQLHLFHQSSPEHKQRLLEIWQAAPPDSSHKDDPHQTWITTSIEREETLARARWERQQAQHQLPQHHQREEHMLDPFIADPPTPSTLSAPPRLRRSASSPTRSSDAEPYMAALYASQASPRALEPVYGARQQNAEAQWMEDQYGMYEQMRLHAEWERGNQEAFGRERRSGGWEAGCAGKIGWGGVEEMEMEM